MLIGFLSRDRILALGSFANKSSAVHMLKNKAELPGSMMALKKEPLDFSVSRRHLVLPGAEIITSKNLTASVCLDNSENFEPNHSFHCLSLCSCFLTVRLRFFDDGNLRAVKAFSERSLFPATSAYCTPGLTFRLVFRFEFFYHGNSMALIGCSVGLVEILI